MDYELLNRVNSPEDLKKLTDPEINEFNNQLRAFLVETVSKSGGHLASNLGVVELTTAIHRVFNSPRDHIIFDVGHQSYVHKIITGRRARFDTLRTPGGLSGFTLMSESEHDAFGAGHSSTSISAALGYAEADRISGSDAYTVAVIGDGAYTGGMAHEALNNIDPALKLIVILNENGMSISANKGAFATYISKVRASKGYARFKSGTVDFLSKLPLIGKPIAAVLGLIKRVIKALIYRPNYFEELGLYYIGRVDGNDYRAVETTLKKAKSLGKAVIIHLKTQKGAGYYLAEQAPDKFHSVRTVSQEPIVCFNKCAADKVIELAGMDEKIVAITAAMGIGTGLSEFEKAYPERYFDVGIAEPHALTFSAGLAAAGYKPYTAIYSTFLQRGYDNIIHDIALQSLPVRLLIDRAGLAASDGATHHGIFDVAFLSQVPGVSIYAPATFNSLTQILDATLDVKNPVAIRYPNLPEAVDLTDLFYKNGRFADSGIYADFDLDKAPQTVIVTYGSIVKNVLDAKKMLLNEGVQVGVVLVEKIKPYDAFCEFFGAYLKDVKNVFYVEEGIRNGGAGMISRDKLLDMGLLCDKTFDVLAIDDNFANPEYPTDLYDFVGLSPAKIANKVKSSIKKC